MEEVKDRKNRNMKMNKEEERGGWKVEKDRKKYI